LLSVMFPSHDRGGSNMITGAEKNSVPDVVRKTFFV
jgi:hypothetical protein